MLSFMDKHCCANSFSDCDSSFGTDNVYTVGVIVGLRLRDELHIGMDTIFEAKRNMPAFTEDESSIPVIRVYLLRMFDVIYGRLASTEETQPVV